MGFLEQDVNGMAKFVGMLRYIQDGEDVAALTEEFKDALAAEPPGFWHHCAFVAESGRQAVTETMQALSPLYPPLPVALACGDNAPAAGIQDSCHRLQLLLPGSKVQYIPCSKGSWQLEGPDCLQVLLDMMGELLSQVAQQ